MVARHPFPGPGLAVRIPGHVDREKVRILQEADAIFIHELVISGWYERTAQAFVVLLPVKTVGIMGDERTYEYMCTLRAVTSEDFMTADWARLPYDLLEKVAQRIVNEVKGINRVSFDITSKPLPRSSTSNDSTIDLPCNDVLSPVHKEVPQCVSFSISLSVSSCQLLMPRCLLQSK